VSAGVPLDGGESGEVSQMLNRSELDHGKTRDFLKSRTFRVATS
jgi:hypothetical protein